MSELSKDQLQELFDAIMGRMQEFELPMPSAVLLTKGAVRVAYDVIAPFVRGQMIPAREEAEDKKRALFASVRAEPVKANGNGHRSLPDPDVARDNIANMMASAAGGALASTIIKPRTLAEINDVPLPAMDNSAKSDQLREIMHELQDMAVDEVMPTMAFWDNAKPPHLPKAQALLMRHLLTWNRLAEYAHLEVSPRAFKSKRKVAEEPSE